MNKDTIYRQDAVEVINKLQLNDLLSDETQGTLQAAKSIIQSIVPSAQPEPHYDEWCTDCKEYDQERHSCPRWNRVIRETLKDIAAEKQSVLIIKANVLMKKEQLAQYRRIFARQKDEGVVLLPNMFDAQYIPDDVKVRMEGLE